MLCTDHDLLGFWKGAPLETDFCADDGPRNDRFHSYRYGSPHSLAIFFSNKSRRVARVEIILLGFGSAMKPFYPPGAGPLGFMDAAAEKNRATADDIAAVRQFHDDLLSFFEVPPGFISSCAFTEKVERFPVFRDTWKNRRCELTVCVNPDKCVESVDVVPNHRAKR